MPVIDTAMGRLSYFDNGCVEGDAPALMLLHSGAASHRQWRALVARLGRHWHVVAPDLVGHGDTPLMTGGRTSLADEVVLLTSLLDRLDGPVHLAGHSYGGALAVHLAQQNPRRIASLALYEPVLFQLLRGSGHTDAWREISLVAQRHVDLVAAGDGRAAAIAFLDYWVGPGALLAMPAPMQAYVTGCMGKVAADFRNLLLQPGDSQPDLSMLTMPVLLLCGGRSTLAARAVGAELRRLLPAPCYLDLPEAGHMAPLLQADLVNTVLADFLETSDLRCSARKKQVV